MHQTSGELGKNLFEDLSSTEIVEFCRKVGKSVWYLGDDLFATHPEELDGCEVDVPEPREFDMWKEAFVGTVVAYVATKHLTVKDPNGDYWDVECDRVDPIV